ncbi:hypothetical protein D2E25_1231 [Bifidobacterium goeldii]|uniref:DUF1287 domain-containing protein n=2 Tax=Bifidobacterium goeldii TaxID=2306975 RepID=A0A430FKN1_9BIFI|nr:hypothetical protein D2E25_1231 [Bifidobacterium goeldii]
MQHGRGQEAQSRCAGRMLAAVLVVVLIVATVIAGIHVTRGNVVGSLTILMNAAVQRARNGSSANTTTTANDDSVMPSDVAAQRYPRLVSSTDFNNNGADDYADIVEGARQDAQAHPTYDDGYYQGGYPPDDRGACTDLVWRAFRNAGYDLKAMVDADIAADPTTYKAVAPKADPNIDFRRTGVLDAFFAKYGQQLTTDIAQHDQWQPGDIVVFEHTRHIGVISDKRDKDGNPYVLHNMNQLHRENDYLAFQRHMTVTGHYRWDAARVPADVLRAWH